MLNPMSNETGESSGKPAVVLSNGSPVTPDHRQLDPVSGMQRAYVVLSPEERRKGFVRPLRRTYVHVGPPGPRFPLRDLTPEEHERHDHYYAKFEAYPAEEGVLGRYWTQAQLDKVGKGCGTATTMGTAIAETYARDPGFYGATFCAGCRDHLPVGEFGEFVWEGSPERVGSSREPPAAAEAGTGEPVEFGGKEILWRSPAQRDDFHDIAEEYALVAIDTPPGVMLWGRVGNRWFANPNPREALRQLHDLAFPSKIAT